VKVDVYRNLTKAVWVIRAREGARKGRVVGYAERVAVTRCRLFVSERRRLAVVRSGRREVHAWVTGDLIAHPEDPPPGALAFSYNPFRGPGFYRCADGGPLPAAGTCWFIGARAFAIP